MQGRTDRLHTFRAALGVQPRLDSHAYLVAGAGIRGVVLHDRRTAAGPEGETGVRVFPLRPLGLSVTGRLAGLTWTGFDSLGPASWRPDRVRGGRRRSAPLLGPAQFPIYLRALHDFAAGANRLAFNRAGIAAATPPPEGGETNKGRPGIGRQPHAFACSSCQRTRCSSVARCGIGCFSCHARLIVT